MTVLNPNGAYSAKQKEKISDIFHTAEKRPDQKFVSAEKKLMDEVSKAVELWRFASPTDENKGKDFQIKGEELHELAKTLRVKINGTSPQMQAAIEAHCKTMLITDDELNGLISMHFSRRGRILDMATEVLRLLELGGKELSEQALVKQGKDYSREKSLIFYLADAWFKVFGEKPAHSRMSRFYRLVNKIFEIEGLGSIGEEPIKEVISNYIQPKA